MGNYKTFAKISTSAKLISSHNKNNNNQLQYLHTLPINLEIQHHPILTVGNGDQAQTIPSEILFLINLEASDIVTAKSKQSFDGNADLYFELNISEIHNAIRESVPNKIIDFMIQDMNTDDNFILHATQDYFSSSEPVQIVTNLIQCNWEDIIHTDTNGEQFTTTNQRLLIPVNFFRDTFDKPNVSFGNATDKLKFTLLQTVTGNTESAGVHQGLWNQNFVNFNGDQFGVIFSINN